MSTDALLLVYLCQTIAVTLPLLYIYIEEPQCGIYLYNNQCCTEIDTIQSSPCPCMNTHIHTRTNFIKSIKLSLCFWSIGGNLNQLVENIQTHAVVRQI